MARYKDTHYRIENYENYLFSIDSHYGMISATVCEAMSLYSYEEYQKMGFDVNDCEKLEVICITNLHIDRSYLGQGLGSDLLKKMIDYCKKHFPNKPLTLCAEPIGHKRFDLDKLVSFYEGKGFKGMVKKKGCTLMRYAA